MASAISGASSSNNLSSLYNSANMISGLASGLDTEGMIESLVQSYQNKIQTLNQKVTKTEWKQEAYRSIISKMVSFNSKYASYTSGTNLLSPSFFNSATTVTTTGDNAKAVSASGKSSSEITLNAVSQLATAARYTTSASNIAKDVSAITSNKTLENMFNGTTTMGTLDGSLTLTYGNKDITISFDELSDKISTTSTDENGKEVTISKEEALAKAIQEKLNKEKITLSSGESVSAGERINVTASGGTISFSDAKSNNSVYISGASGNLEKELGLDLEKVDEKRISTISKMPSELTKEVSNTELISNKSMSITLDGVKKGIALPTIKTSGDKDTGYTYTIGGTDYTEIDKAKEAYINALNTQLNSAFQGAVTAKEDNGNLVFQLNKKDATTGAYTDQPDEDSKSTLVMESSAGDAMGIGTTATNYLTTNETLGDLGIDFKDMQVAYEKDKDGKDTTTPLKDANGNQMYVFEINGEVIGNYSKDSKLSDIMSDINTNADAGVKVSYSKLSKTFVFTAKETGSNQQINIEEGSLAAQIFGATADNTGKLLDSTEGYEEGKNSIFNVTVNGETMMLERSSNSVDLDGLTVNFKDTFVEEHVDATDDSVFSSDKRVNFTVSADADKIVEAVKSMIADYNIMISEIKSAYTTLPAQTSSGKSYEPLTDDDMADMSESAIEKYEEKAKQGLLFGDSTLSGLYEKLRFTFSGSDSNVLQKMGISTSYSTSDGSLTVTLDETKLRNMLDSDPDAVTEVFTKEGGIMQNLKSQMDAYASTTGATKGILIEKAGSPLSSLSLLNNTFQNQIDDINEEIEKWQDRLADKVDSYTSQFSRLEVLINQMNSQSSMLAGLSG